MTPILSHGQTRTIRCSTIFSMLGVDLVNVIILRNKLTGGRSKAIIAIWYFRSWVRSAFSQGRSKRLGRVWVILPNGRVSIRLKIVRLLIRFWREDVLVPTTDKCRSWAKQNKKKAKEDNKPAQWAQSSTTSHSKKNSRTCVSSQIKSEDHSTTWTSMTKSSTSIK